MSLSLHSFIKYFLVIYNVPATVTETEDTTINKTEKPHPQGGNSQPSKKTDKKFMIMKNQVRRQSNVWSEGVLP